MKPTTQRMWVAGQWIAATGGATREVINPTDQTVIGQVPEATVKDVDSAIAAAREAFDHGPWGKKQSRDRGTVLFKIAEVIRSRAAELAELDTRNMGKPIVEAEFDVADAAACFEYYAGWASKIHGETLTVPDNALSMVIREPVGVVGQIIPWNYPLLMAAWKLAPALAAGCTMVLKPAEQTPLSALVLGEILAQADLPPGVVNIVTGDGPVAGAQLVTDPRVDKIAFTGGVQTGRAIIKNAAETIKRMSIELGGKSPNIVFADSDFEQAVDGALFGAFANQGEVCSAGSRLLVEKSIYPKMVAALAEKVKRVRLGDPLDRNTKMGPLVTSEHRDKVLSYIEIGKKEAKLLCGGGAPRHGALGKGLFVEPTIFVDVDPKARIAQEEIFGPVLAVMPFDNEEEAIRLANDTIYGLAGAVWTRDVFRGVRVLKQIRAGILWLNNYHPTYNEAPWGGYKQSGFGRELGAHGLDHYLETKQINLNLTDAPLGWYQVAGYIKLTTEIPGPKSRALLERRTRAVAPGVATAHPIFVAAGAGPTLTDVDGNTYLDFAGGIGVMNVGHARQEVTQAIAEQAARLTHACFQVAGYEEYVAVCEALCAIAPGLFEKRAFLASTGAEAVENAVKIARRHTGRAAVLCFEHAFHGRTLLGMSLTGKTSPYKIGFGPFAAEIYRLPFPYPYRDEGPRKPLEQALQTIVRPQDLAAVIIEPVLGEGGFIVPPRDFLLELRELCDQHGIVFIADEIQSGFGRTGAMFACQNHGLVPDLITVAKSIAGGLPLSAVVGRASIMDAVPPGGLGGTYAGNPVACAAALQAIAILVREVESCRPAIIGEQICDRLRALQLELPMIGEVRGLGPMQALELVRDRHTKEPAPQLTAAVIAAARARGLLLLSAGTFGNVIRLLAPLTIPDAALHEGLTVLAEALRLCQPGQKAPAVA